MEQRKPWLRGSGIDHLPNHESFDLEFSPTGQVIRETRYTHAEDVCGSSYFVYDDAARLIRTIKFDETDTETSICEFEYSESGRIWTCRDGAGVVTGGGLDKYEGTSLILHSTYAADGLPMVSKSFEYRDGKLFKAVANYFGLVGILAHTWISSFDSLGRLSETYAIKPDGTPLGDGRHNYEYDADGRKVEVLAYNDFDDSNVPNSISRFTYKCDEHGNWVERNDYH